MIENSKSEVLPSRIVLGGASLTGLTFAQASALLRRAEELGICEIDTSPSYGNSESLIGKYIKESQSQIRINSKIGRLVSGEINANSVESQFDSTLSNLGVSHINNCFIHSLPSTLWKEAGIRDKLINLKESGLVSYIGYSGDNSDLIESADEIFDSYMLTFNYFDRANFPFLMKKAESKQIYLKRVLANSAWNLPTSTKLRNGLHMILTRKSMFDTHSYEFRALKMAAPLLSSKFDLKKILGFILSIASGAPKIVVGCSSLKHLEELVAIEAQANRLSLTHDWEKYLYLSKKYGWEARV